MVSASMAVQVHTSPTAPVMPCIRSGTPSGPVAKGAPMPYSVPPEQRTGGPGAETISRLADTTRLEDLTPNTAVRGVLPDCLVTVLGVQWFGSEALELTYKDQRL